MTKTSLILDCDPGVDDAIALFLAFASPELELLAVTTVGGNVGLELTARNARIIREIAGREDVPVHAGAAAPLVRKPVAASDFHGESGLGDLQLFEPRAPLAAGDAVSAIIDAVMARPAGSVAIAVTGPMTNLALAMRRQPAIVDRLGPIVVMGGARSEGGNITASAEYNIYADPHAADEVFRAGRRIIVHGLDATHQVRTSPQRIAAIARIGTRATQAAAQLLTFSANIHHTRVDDDGAPLHDPCTIAWLLKPDLFVTAPVDLQVETGSQLTMGHTAVEFRLPDPGAARVQWATKANADGFFALLTERLAR